MCYIVREQLCSWTLQFMCYIVREQLCSWTLQFMCYIVREQLCSWTLQFMCYIVRELLCSWTLQFMEIKRQIFWWVSVTNKKGRALGFPPFLLGDQKSSNAFWSP